jgi:hypothetical protein
LSAYSLQKVIRQINRDAAMRASFMASPSAAIEGMDLTAAERDALAGRDYRALYKLGVHGLILRPFSIINGVSEQDYLIAIRGEQ